MAVAAPNAFLYVGSTSNMSRALASGKSHLLCCYELPADDPEYEKRCCWWLDNTVGCTYADLTLDFCLVACLACNSMIVR